MRAKRPNLPAKQRRALKRAHKRVKVKGVAKTTKQSNSDALNEAWRHLLIEGLEAMLFAFMPFPGPPPVKPAGLINDAKTIDLRPGEDFTVES